jgi:hypothetical protein
MTFQASSLGPAILCSVLLFPYISNWLYLHKIVFTYDIFNTNVHTNVTAPMGPGTFDFLNSPVMASYLAVLILFCFHLWVCFVAPPFDREYASAAECALVLCAITYLYVAWYIERKRSRFRYFAKVLPDEEALKTGCRRFNLDRIGTSEALDYIIDGRFMRHRRREAPVGRVVYFDRAVGGQKEL